MEIHSVLPEERARDEKGEVLPWGYRYADSSRNTRQPEESGPFGKHRSGRHNNSRASRTRTGTTPVRQKENTAVAEFGRLFANQQAKDEDDKSKRMLATAGPGDAPLSQPESVATECILHGYANKNSEWKVLSKYEKIVAPSIICEDYPRDDPNLLMSNSPSGFSRSSVIVQRDLSRDALKKSRVYRGGQHWIKVTFDSYAAADRACFFSPVEIDGCMVHCALWQGKPPATDLPIPKGTEPTSVTQRTDGLRTVGPAQAPQYAKDSALVGFERAMQTLPRSHTMPDVQYSQPRDDISITSTTASSATASEAPTSGLRSRSVPQLPSQVVQDPTSQYMTHIPSVKKAILRPISEALPPQPSFTEKVLRSLPVVSWFVGRKGAPGDLIGEGPLLKEDGRWDEKNGWYWSFWHSLDRLLGTDFCGLKDD